MREKREEEDESIVRIVAIGSGYTVLEAAPAIKRGAPHAHVTVINREPRHATMPHAPELLAGTVHLEDISVDLEQHYRRHNVEFILGGVTTIDREHKRVYVGDVEVPYDYLILDAGSEPEHERIPGVERAHSKLSPTGMLELRAHLITQFLKLRATNDPKHRTFVVAGAGVSGIETAGALKTLANQLCEQHLIFPHEVAIVVAQHDANEYPFPTHVRGRIKRILEERDIEYYDGKVTKFSSQGVDIGDVTIESETLVWCGPKRASHVLQSLGLPLDEYGAASVNHYFQTEDPAIFAAGDCASIPHAPARHIPRTAFMAFDEEQALAENVLAAVHGKRMRRYRPRAPLPVFVSTSPSTALLITPFYSWHGKVPAKLKQWALRKYARRVKLK